VIEPHNHNIQYEHVNFMMMIILMIGADPPATLSRPAACFRGAAGSVKVAPT